MEDERKPIDIYIYKNVSGKIVEIPAYIFKPVAPKMMLTLTAYDRDNNHFLAEIGKEPGMVFNDYVWFKKKNFKHAKNIFLSDIAERLEELDIKYKDLRDELSFMSEQEEEK